MKEKKKNKTYEESYSTSPHVLDYLLINTSYKYNSIYIKYKRKEFKI